MPLTAFSYTEQNGSGKFSSDKGKQSGERIFRLTNYRDAPAFVAVLTGGIEFTTADGQTYNIPDKFLPNLPLYCTSATAEGIGVPTGDADGPNYAGGAIIVAHYETLSYDPTGSHGDQNPAPITYVTEQRSTGGQTLTLAKKGSDSADAWEWISDGELLDEDAPDIVKVMPEGEYVLTRHFVATHPRSTIDDLIGKINDDSFPTQSSMGGYAAGTLLFFGDQSTRDFTSDGAKAFEISYRFGYNPNGWNSLYRPDTGAYELVGAHHDPSKRIYESADFDPLLN